MAQAVPGRPGSYPTNTPFTIAKGHEGWLDGVNPDQSLVKGTRTRFFLKRGICPSRESHGRLSKANDTECISGSY